MRAFFRTWFFGYYHPAAFVGGLELAPAPWWGLAGALGRALMDAFLLYLPMALLGRQPQPPSYLSLFPTESYFHTLVWLAPLVLTAQWLLSGGAMHLALRAAQRRSDFDLLLNISGMVALVVGTFLLVWDWLWVWCGPVDYIFLGISHLVIDVWGILLSVLALKKLLGVPLWLGLALNLLAILVGLPFGMLFMRSPV